jgi:4-hydroxybenzoate polyprenyltransferase
LITSLIVLLTAIAAVPFGLMAWCWWLGVRHAESWLHVLLGSTAGGFVLAGIDAVAGPLAPQEAAYIVCGCILISMALRLVSRQADLRGMSQVQGDGDRR